MNTLKKSVFLVHQSHDEHHAIYGVFNSMDEFIESFKTEDTIPKARLLNNYVIFEMAGKVVIDEISVSDIEDSLEEFNLKIYRDKTIRGIYAVDGQNVLILFTDGTSLQFHSGKYHMSIVR